MIDQRGDKNAEDDGNGATEFRSQQKGQQLGFVADFCEGDDAGGYEEGFHKRTPGRRERNDHAAPPAKR